jgi:hypothetical protein
MPNVKIYVDAALLDSAAAQVDGLLLQARDAIMAGLGVAEAACHIVVLAVRSLPGQTPVNIELCMLQQPGRSREKIEQVCLRLRDLVARGLEAPSAIRCTLAEPETYIVIRAG